MNKYPDAYKPLMGYKYQIFFMNPDSPALFPVWETAGYARDDDHCDRFVSEFLFDWK